MGRLGAVLLPALIVASGCGVTMSDFRTQKPAPPPTSAANTEQAEQSYQDFRLEYGGGVWNGMRWKRRDGVYELREIDPILATMPETAEPRADLGRRLLTM